MVEDDIQKHALEAYPYECVGYVLDGEYIRLENISNTPEKRYQLSAKDKLQLYRLGSDLQALVHSHPTMDSRPSELDIKVQKSSGFTFWIIGTDGVNTTKIRRVHS